MTVVQGIAQLQLLLGHLNKTDQTGTLIKIAVSYLELEIGLGKCPLGYPHTTTLEHVTMTWVNFVAHFLHTTGCCVELRTDRQVKKQRKNNKFIMQVALDGNYNLRLIQQCRLRLQVCTLADICDAAGRRVEKWAFHNKGRRSTLRWMAQGEPSGKAWRAWSKFLQSLVTVTGASGGQHLEHTYRLGEWHNTHQQWKWMGNQAMAVNANGKRYWREGTCLRPITEQMHYVPTKLYPLSFHKTRHGLYCVRDSGCTSHQSDPGDG